MRLHFNFVNISFQDPTHIAQTEQNSLVIAGRQRVSVAPHLSEAIQKLFDGIDAQMHHIKRLVRHIESHLKTAAIQRHNLQGTTSGYLGRFSSPSATVGLPDQDTGNALHGDLDAFAEE